MSQLERSGSGNGLMQAATRSRRRWRATRAPDTFAAAIDQSIADICLVAHLTSAKMLCDSDPEPYPTARRIHDACMQIEAFALEHPMRQAGAQGTAPL